MTTEEAYHIGFIDGLKCFAWWKDGEELVGSLNTKLKDAAAVARTQWNYRIPFNTEKK